MQEGAAGARLPRPGCETARMPVLEPNPKNGQRKFLQILGAMLLLTVVIAVVASVVSP